MPLHFSHTLSHSSFLPFLLSRLAKIEYTCQACFYPLVQLPGLSRRIQYSRGRIERHGVMFPSLSRGEMPRRPPL